MALSFCFVTTFYPPYHFGGDGVFVYRLAHALAERGHSVDVIHSEDAYRLAHAEDPPVDYAEHPRITRRPLRSSRPSLASLRLHQTGRPDGRLKELLSGKRYDVIHYHNVSLMGAPGVLRLGEGLKLYTTHEYWLVCPTHVLFRFDREACTKRTCLACTLHARRPPQLWRWTGALKRGLAAVDHLLVPSRFAMARHLDQGIRRPITILPHFVPEPASAAAFASERPYFLFVGRLEKLKGLQDVLEVMRDVRDADLVVVGNGTYERELRARAAGLDHVRFIGTVHPTELSAYYRGAVALLAPSLCYETFGLTAAEAMAHGTPAIVRRIGALTEIVEESDGGVAFTTPEELRAALHRMLSKPAWRAERAAAGRAHAAAHWSVDVHLDQYLGHLESWR